MSHKTLPVQDQVHWFWHHSFWLPRGVTWGHLKSENGRFAKFEDLLYPIPIAIGIILLRFCLDRFVFLPIGKYYGMKNRRATFKLNPLLEAAYQSNLRRGRGSKFDFTTLSKQTDLQVRQIERWFRRRSVLDKPNKLAKFRECGWRCFAYVSAIIVGVSVLWDKPWLSDVMYVWYGYPNDHVVTPGIWWYYMSSLALYYSFMFSHFSDVHHKDFWQMFIHHIATIFLIGMSWMINMFRFGTLVLLVHDLADPWLEAAKMAKYTKFTKSCWFFFGGFVVMFVLTRLCVYPFHILRTMFLDAEPYFPFFPALSFFYVMLSLLLVLHIFWAYLVFKVIYRAGFCNELRDSRSSASEISSESEAEGQNEDEEDAAGDYKSLRND